VQEEENILLHISEIFFDRPQPLEGAQSLVPDWLPDVAFLDPPVPAAVLIALVERPNGRTVVYTQRSPDLRSHSGQIAFPGGKIDAHDADAGQAALRESEEEIGLEPACAKILGYMAPYETGTNYVITPVIASVTNRACFVPNPREVDEVFEVPLKFIMQEDNYGTFSIERMGRQHSTWMLDYQGHVIWGITAHLTRRFRDMVLRGGEGTGSGGGR